jgi:hypothetical protein
MTNPVESQKLLGTIVALFAVAGLANCIAAQQPVIETIRVSNHGVQPQVAVDEKGVVHLVYLAGAAAHSDVYYARSTDDGVHFSEPLRVNDVAGSAIAIGTVRGAHIAIGKNRRVHVAWLGSDRAEPKAEDGASPMLYSRLNERGDAFEPERNVIQKHPGLDGGGSVAADQLGNVFVVWHAPSKTGGDELSRCVWMVHSSDEGKTFAPEVAASSSAVGACGCCGMRSIADGSGHVLTLYRSAERGIDRDMYLVDSTGDSEHFEVLKLHPMKSDICVMSTAALARDREDILAAWETEQQIYSARIAQPGLKATKPIGMPGEPKQRKHPSIAVNGAGQVLIAWTEGTGWSKGGSVAWQAFDRNGKPIDSAAGRRDDLPVWGAPAAFARSDGSFVIFY